jgi:hypothetical protein
MGFRGQAIWLAELIAELWSTPKPLVDPSTPRE